MPKATFTTRWVQGLKPPQKGQVDYFDTKPGGLILRVSPKGVKTWCMFYRYNGRLRRLTIGKYPILSLADARPLATRARREVALGQDPATQKQSDRHAMTVGELADEYLELYAKIHKRSWRNDARILNAEILPQWGLTKAADISRRDVIALLDKIVARDAPISANRTLALVRKMFNWAISRDMIEYNPCHQIKAPGKERQRDRVLTEDETRSVWAIWQTLPLDRRIHFELRLLTAQRGVEIVTMRWNDIDFATGWWTIPATITKNELTHRVPLSQPASDRLQILYDTRQGLYVFPSSMDSTHHIPAVTIQRHSRAVRKEVGIDFELHDLRRTAASLMTGMGISRLVVGMILNHVEQGVIKVYDRHSYDAEKRDALDRWGRKVMAIVGQGEPAKVVPLHR